MPLGPMFERFVEKGPRRVMGTSPLAVRARSLRVANCATQWRLSKARDEHEAIPPC